MSGYVQSIQTYLREIGEVESKKLGDSPALFAPGALAGPQGRVERSLREEARKTDRIVAVAVVLLCSLFVAGLGLVIYYRDSPERVAVIFGGGTFASLLGIIAWLRKLWFDKRTMDLLLVSLESMSPSDAAKVLTTFYFGALAPKQPTT
jgi:hypothetical protein